MQKLSLELFSELVYHFQMQRYVDFFGPGRRGTPCITNTSNDILQQFIEAEKKCLFPNITQAEK